MKRSFAIPAIIIILAVIPTVVITGCITSQEWSVDDDGFLKYPGCEPDYRLTLLETADNYTLHGVNFTSRDATIAGLLRIPRTKHTEDRVPGIVLLPGATVTKEGEQRLAKYLCGLGYGSIAIDQRNLGGINMEGDRAAFLNGEEPTQHKMVHDALSAAGVLRDQPTIDPARTLYLGESNGGRFAIIATALDSDACGVIAISTCGYGIDAAVASGQIQGPSMVRFYRSIDPDTYLNEISPRKFVMIHSLNDTIIPYDSAQQTYMKIGGRKSLHTTRKDGHGYSAEMNPFLEKELAEMFS
ncbi:MAG: acetylxylan esterase [Euryarchaeota archaeon]|nr:acetylxylan esterase [Euryarchaeota archaeon]